MKNFIDSEHHTTLQLKTTLNCPITPCPMTKNPRKYIAQLIYMIISTAVVIRSNNDFSGFSILLLIAPTLIDLIFNTTFRGNVLKNVKRIFIGIDLILFTIALLIIFQVLTFDFENFLLAMNSNSVIWQNKGLSLWVVIGGLFIHCIIPIMFYFGSPDIKTYCEEAGISYKIDYTEE